MAMTGNNETLDVPVVVLVRFSCLAAQESDPVHFISLESLLISPSVIAARTRYSSKIVVVTIPSVLTWCWGKYKRSNDVTKNYKTIKGLLGAFKKNDFSAKLCKWMEQWRRLESGKTGFLSWYSAVKGYPGSFFPLTCSFLIVLTHLCTKTKKQKRRLERDLKQGQEPANLERIVGHRTVFVLLLCLSALLLYL